MHLPCAYGISFQVPLFVVICEQVYLFLLQGFEMFSGSFELGDLELQVLLVLQYDEIFELEPKERDFLFGTGDRVLHPV